MIKNMLGFYDLRYTDAEIDSAFDGLKRRLAIYKDMHRSFPANDLSFPFAFHPAPAGLKVPGKKAKISWDIPGRVELPANPDDLAWYSIPQLASLLINKKISSVDLTKYFLERFLKGLLLPMLALEFHT